MQPVGHLVVSVVADLLRTQPLSPEKVAFAWRAAVGETLARVTTPALQPDGTLEVRAADSRWRRELDRSHDVIRDRLQTFLGPDIVRRISVTTPRHGGRAPGRRAR